MQPGVTYAPSSGIKDLGELRGKRVALPQFWMTSSVWHRLILHLNYGVSQGEVHWVTMAPERLASLGLPPGARQETSGRSIGELMQAGELDAQMGPGNEGRGPADGGRAAASGPPPIPAFPNMTEALRDYFVKTRILPIAHLIVMKKDLAEGEPGLVESLCAALEEAKLRGLKQALDTPGERPIPGLSVEETVSLFGPDPWAYGVSRNRAVLETFLEDAHHQGLTGRPMSVEELFVSNAPPDLR
jgi:4,5-dihydroxyphthalate decarboxylase